jgi:hypothetical protein
MDISVLNRNKTVCTCKYCDWKGMPWSTGTFYQCVDWIEKTRTVRIYCPSCMTIDSIEYKEYTNIEDHPLLIKNREKLKKIIK